jgi:multiple sugar transport system substrate-binding protein
MHTFTASWSGLVRRLALCLLLGMAMALSTAVAQNDHPLAGESIDMTILGIGGWVPSSLGAEMANDLFKPYALENYGYDVTFRFDAAPFAALFQRAAASLATRSNEYNIIISDSQWLGALSEPGWIVNVNDIIEEHPELDIEWYSEIVGVGYQEYPMYSGIRWGFPQAGDVVVMFVRRDMLLDEAERAAFLQQYGASCRPSTKTSWR